MQQRASQIAADGSPVLVYARLPPGVAEADVITSAVPRGARLLELGAGAGRVSHVLLARGYAVTAVDNSPEMLAEIRGAEPVVADIETLALGVRFDAVVLGSHMVNTDDDAQRRAFLRACRDHVADHGAVLVEHHAAAWLQTAKDGESQAGSVVVALRDVRRHAPFVTATAEYLVDGHAFRQTFTARVFDEAELAQELHAAGFGTVTPLNATWTLARPAT